jgi:predicted ATP-dependent endonuclease of OLD family
MSETKEHQPAYISRVHLKGYKSIRDLEIDFKAGLNIIIGPNGSGKTNFLEFLHGLFYDKTDSQFIVEPFSSKIEFTSVFGTNTTEKTGIFDNKNNSLFLTVTRKDSSNGQPVYETELKILQNGLREYVYVKNFDANKMPLRIFPTLINFGNVWNEYLSNSLTLRYINYINSEKEDETFMFLPSTETDIVKKIIKNDNTVNVSINNIQQKFNINKDVLRNLKSFTLIKDLVIKTEKLNTRVENGLLYVENFELSFFVNNKWLNWKQLSDGTKRMFLIIVSVVNESIVCFLEEPELGIHPDQLYLLMDFLKEQSKEKQIIITTHSPEVLNILDKTELDRIIVTRYDAEKGTQMHHLSPKKIRKGVSYMSKEGLTLKDFWVHSNLEEYDEEEYEIR